MKNDPQQELFTKLKISLEAKGYDVYEGFLPPEGTLYPFIYLGEMTQNDTANKTAVFGQVRQKIKVWHNDPHKRGTLSKIMLDIKEVCREIDETQNFEWFVKSMNQSIRPDPTTNPPLLMGDLDVTFNFN